MPSSYHSRIEFSWKGMEMKRVIALVFAMAFLAAPAAAQECVKCHVEITPNIVEDWRLSAHYENNIECSICHGDEHNSADDVEFVEMPTADTCGQCHDTQLTQFTLGKHAAAWASYKAMPTTHMLPAALGAGKKGCGGCHKLGLKTEEEVKALRAEGSVFGNASCDACHTRHTFSVKEAREPQACQTCHMGFDHPAVGDVFILEARGPATC